ncbi:flavodoxin domain-containing protein [Thiocystis violascens]|uniref:flavodoxin domain-containing protein n=1 Tax=Thiocystis violascens TaxID=73141 RepID=UPI00022C27AF|nr:flavodoxin domain-containing protein [Thiocystis violascens]
MPDPCALSETSKDGVRGKTGALFGLGDQSGYPHELADALGLLCEELEARGAHVVGDWPTEGYDFDASKSDRGQGFFCGLVLDEDNQFDLTESRLDAWIERIAPAMLSVIGPRIPAREEADAVG